jgi:predicted DNA-binding transcriptional regulator AlpA
MENPFESILSELAEIKEALQIKSKVVEKPVEVIDREELQRRLGLSEPTVIRYEKKGKIPAIRIGPNVRYNWAAVVAALEKNS